MASLLPVGQGGKRVSALRRSRSRLKVEFVKASSPLHMDPPAKLAGRAPSGGDLAEMPRD